MRKPVLIACVSALIASFGAVQVQADQTEAITKAISGKTIFNDSAEFKVRKNGKLTGKAGKTKFKGAWAIRKGKWCRTFTEPKKWAGTECQPAKLSGNTITITGRNGPQVWKIK